MGPQSEMIGDSFPVDWNSKIIIVGQLRGKEESKPDRI